MNCNVYGIIYVIINLIDSKKYVGQTTKKMKGRWDGTLKGAENASYNQHLISSMRKYGINNFKSDVLLKCYSQEDLDFFEDYYIVIWDTMNPKKGYNKKRGGSNGRLNENEQTLTMQTVKEVRKSLLGEELSSAKACVLISCRPSVELLRKVANKYPNIDFEKTKKVVQEIEKRLWQKNLHRKSTAVVGLAIYLGNNISQLYAAFIMDDFGICRNITIHSLGKIVKMFKKQKKYTELDRKQLIKNILTHQNWECLYCNIKFEKNNKIYCLLYRNINEIYCLDCKEKLNKIGGIILSINIIYSS
ncbi:hypothetical protein LCGC14_1662950 [marine sediment metagenome]|uniref:GIY-YIG domain-containing protein n=1 Tax=marine sediment metagenome TaxID=412755 RepID=A0A0F9IG13_9ZZZZ